jgi:hypothetical protein
MAGIGCSYGAESPVPCTVFPWQDCPTDSGPDGLDVVSVDAASDAQADSITVDAQGDGKASDGAEIDGNPSDGIGTDTTSDVLSIDGPADATLLDALSKDGGGP